MFQVFRKDLDQEPLLAIDLNSAMDNSQSSIEMNRVKPDETCTFDSRVCLDELDESDHPNETVRLSLYEDLKPVLFIEMILGVLPVQKINTEFRLSTWMMIYSLAVYVTLLVLDVIFYYPWLRDAADEGLDDFTESMTLTLSIFLQFLIIMIPAINWPEVRGVTRYFNAWEQFQTTFHNTTGSPLKFYFYRRLIIFCTISVTFHSIMAILDSHANYHSILLFESVTEFLLFLCLYTLRDMLTFHWYFVCRGLSTASTHMLRLFRKELSMMDSSSNPTQCIIKYRSLWWELSKLARQLGAVSCYTYFFYIVYLFVTLVMYVHFVVVVILKPQNILGIILCLTEILNIIFLLFLVCNSANNATNQISNDFRHELVAAGQEHTDVETRRTIKEFLRTTEFEPPKINLGGYVNVDSKLLFLLTVVLVTYTVLLTQVGLSASKEDDDDTDNATTTVASTLL